MKQNDSCYPKLLKHPETDTVVCFVEEEYGTVIYPTNHTHRSEEHTSELQSH